MVKRIIPIVDSYPDIDSLSQAAARDIYLLILNTLKVKNSFSLCLSGGNTPRTLYQLLASEYNQQIPWNQIFLFWGDERCVPPDHPDSNFKMTYDSLLSKINIPSLNYFRIPAEMIPTLAGVDYYELTLKGYFPDSKKSSSPTFDLLLLGMGDDGHTASLFPKDPVLQEKSSWVKSVTAPDYMSPKNRITLTLPVLNRSKNTFFLISGDKKRKIAESITQPASIDPSPYPAALIHGLLQTKWFLA